MNLGTKFNIVVLGLLAVGLAATGTIAWTLLQSNAREEVIERAGLMMESALAMRGYTVEEIRPLLAPHMADKFLPQTVPAYAATQAFGKLRERHAAYVYKEATLNPTNPRDRATDWETDIVESFRNFPDRTEVIGERDTPVGPSLYLARPIRIENEACLACHSTPDRAPAPMVSQYGDANGFGWQLHEVVGAQIVSVPMEVPIAKAQRTFATFMGSIGGALLVLVVVLNVMLRRMVVRPLTRMAEAADSVSRGALDAPEFPAAGEDEIATLAVSFNRMRRSLEKALGMLTGKR